MSTRGTYTITYRLFDKKVRTQHFYIHCDNYLSGCAAYMKMFIEGENRRGAGPEQFIRSIPWAEYTSHPDVHGDTEFHYEINSTNWTIDAYEIKQNWEHPELTKKCLVFSGLITEFINKYYEKEEGEKSPDCIMFRGRPQTREMLQKYYNEQFDLCLNWTARGHIGNASGMASECAKIYMTLNPNMSLPKEYEFLAKIYADSYGWESPQQFIEKIFIA